MVVIGGLGIAFVAPGSMLRPEFATKAIVRLLHSEVHHHHSRKLARLKPSSSFFSVDSAPRTFATLSLSL